MEYDPSHEMRSRYTGIAYLVTFRPARLGFDDGVMNRFVAVAILAACGLAGCKAVDGSYYPDCIAFAGDNLELQNGRFSWDKFTDQVRADDQGRPVDPFPEYPRYGSYKLDGDTLTLRFDVDGPDETFHIADRNGRIVLLRTAEYSEWQDSGNYPQCVLTREDDR